MFFLILNFRSFSLRLLVTILALSSCVTPGYAGPFQDDLLRCISESLTEKDKTNFSAFIALALSRLPELRGIVLVDDLRSDAIILGYAKTIERLILIDCNREAKEVVKFEGPVALAESAGSIGQLAIRERLSGSEMNKLLDRMEPHMNQAAWDELMMPD